MHGVEPIRLTPGESGAIASLWMYHSPRSCSCHFIHSRNEKENSGLGIKGPYF
jgi:hypothetical protein